MPVVPPVRVHLHLCLEATPAVLESMLQGIPETSDLWDLRPDPERFTAREVLAHLADWNVIFAERLTLTLAETKPALPRLNEQNLPAERAYHTQSPLANIARFRQTRAELLAQINALKAADWDRLAHREDMGDLAVSDQVVLVAIHDAYHSRQIAEYLQTFNAADPGRS